jgi:hypothetical protein
MSPYNRSDFVGTASQPPSPFERIEEYKAVLDDTAHAAERRRTSTTLYVGLNSLFLTGIGLYAAPHFGSWETVTSVAIVMIVALPVNIIWYAGLARWARNLTARMEYVRSIEQEFRARRGEVQGDPQIGLFLYLHSKNVGRLGTIRLEQRLALYFAFLYPIATVSLAIFAWVLQTPDLPPLPFR